MIRTLPLTSVAAVALALSVATSAQHAGSTTSLVHVAPVTDDVAFDPAFATALAQQSYLKASNPAFFFGSQVAISGDTLVVGAPEESSNATGVDGTITSTGFFGAGAAYVFVRSGGSWSQQAFLKASNTGVADNFGISVAIDGDTIVIGAEAEDSEATGVNGSQGDDINGNGSGAAYVFTRSSGTWSQQAYLKASNTNASDRFGRSVGVSGDSIVIGAYLEDSSATGVNGSQSNNSASDAGAAYVFTRTGSTWSQQAYLKASNAQGGDQFGNRISLAGDTILVGVEREDSNATGVNGAQGNNSSSDSGAAYVFTRTGSAWTQQAYLKASNTEASDRFGSSVALSGDTAVIGARSEGSSSTGVNGDDGNNGALSAGAAFVFQRTGSTWAQQAYLKASNTEASDEFGGSVGIDGDTIVIGARNENSAASGVNGDQFAPTSAMSGAGYIFTRTGSTWAQDAYLKASNTGSGDFFGRAVAVSGDTTVVGASGEDSNALGVNGDEANDFGSNSGAAYVFAPASSGPWSDEGCALAGVNGAPMLEGTGSLAGGSANTLELTNAAPSALMGLFVAISSAPVSFKGGTLKAFPFQLLPFFNTNGSGVLNLPFIMPTGVPAGTEFWFQAGIQDATAVKGIALSNAVVGTAP